MVGPGNKTMEKLYKVRLKKTCWNILELMRFKENKSITKIIEVEAFRNKGYD